MRSSSAGEVVAVAVTMVMYRCACCGRYTDGSSVWGPDEDHSYQWCGAELCRIVLDGRVA